MILEKISQAVINGDVQGVKELAQQGLEDGITPQQLLDDGVLAGMEVVGDRFKNFDMYIPEVLKSAKVMHEVMDILRPHVISSDDGEMYSKGTVVLGTVEGDMHDIGKNLVSLMLEGAGFKVVDIGIDQSPQSFVRAIEKESPQVVGMSALLTTTAPKISETIAAFEEAGVRDSIKTMAGGAVIDQAFVDENGVDAYGASATAAMEIAQKFVNEVKQNAS